jgi:integrase
MTVAAYLAAHAASHSRATLRRRLVALGQVHRPSGHPWSPSHPAIRNTLRGILRRHGVPARQVAALTTSDLRRLVATCDTGLAGVRDRALLLLAYAGALRRAELVAVHLEHIQFEASGLRLTIPRAKTDQEGQGATLGISRGEHRETCPVRALEAWLDQSGSLFGSVFRRVTMWGRRRTLGAAPRRHPPDPAPPRRPGRPHAGERPAPVAARIAVRLRHRSLSGRRAGRADHGAHPPPRRQNHARLCSQGAPGYGKPGAAARL